MRIAGIVAFFLLSHFLIPHVTYAQHLPHAVIRGRVLDDSTLSPIPTVNVFVSNSSIGTATRPDGSFQLKGVPLGNQEIVASIVGFEPQTKMLRLADSAVYTVEFRLRQKPVQFEGVEVQASQPTEWKKNLRRFLDQFLGTTPNAEQCTVLNPEVLDFSIGGAGMFTASARGPLEIENRALGYRVQCLLDFYSDSPVTLLPVVTMDQAEPPRKIDFVCRSRFTLLDTSDQRVLAGWREHRKNAYYGSMRHFLSSLVVMRTEKEEFALYVPTYKGIGEEYLRRLRVSADTLINPRETGFERRLSFTGRIQVVYSGSDERQTSSMQLSNPSVTFTIEGLLDDPLSITTYGYWATQRIADMLPIDYRPEER